MDLYIYEYMENSDILLYYVYDNTFKDEVFFF